MAIQPAGAVMPPAQRRHGTAVSYLWAAVPLVTLGLATWAVFLFAAARQRSWWLGGASAGYAALLVVWVVAAAPERTGPLADGIMAAAFIACMFGGFAHALAVRSQVFPAAAPRPGDLLHEAEHEALRRRGLREQARELATRDPALARQLGIGRPDLRRDYDDGGLVDVNHAPAAVLATLPGVTPDLAARAVELRDTRGAFVSADDLALALDMPSTWVTPLSDLTVYLG
jgi:hypothetical protein